MKLKKLLCIVLSLAMLFGTMSFSSFAEDEVIISLAGTGTEADPFLISTVEELELFRSSVNAGETKYNAEGLWVALADDIDLAGTTWTVGIGDGHNWSFDGCFDGNGYTIKNLNMEPYADESGYVCAGLFGYIYGPVVIRDLVIENVTIDCEDIQRTGNVDTEPHNVGILAGFAYKCQNALIENITVTGDIEVNAPNVDGVGSIVGYSYYALGTIKDCTVDVNDDSYIEGYSFVGGITGYSYSNSTIANCSVNNIDIIANSKSAGGIAGIVLSGNKISDCTVEESVTVDGQANVGSVVGAIASNGIIVENCTAPGAMVGGNYADDESVSVRIGDKYYSTLDAAFAAANGDTVTLVSDIELSEPIVIGTDDEIVLDLNGFTMTYNSTVMGEAMITNKGDLTIEDSDGEGVINYNYTGAADNSYGKGNYTISNAGNLTVNGGKITIANLSGHAKYPIDNNSTTGDAILVINDGHLYNYNTSAIRQFCNSTTYKNSVTINGGLIEGYCAIWIQNPGSKTVNGKLEIAGGEVRTTAKAYVNGTAELKDVSSKIYCTISGAGGAWSDDSAVSITGGVINENISLKEKSPATVVIGDGAVANGNIESANHNKGTWGGIDWTLDAEGTLTIAPTKGTPVADPNSGKEFEVGAWRETVVYNASGTGIAIGGQPYDMNKVKKLVIEEGVTSIGSFTAKFPKLTGKVVIPSTVKYIGQETFQNTQITELVFAMGGTEELCIGPGAFKNIAVKEFVLPDDRPEIHIHCWNLIGSKKLESITLPDNITTFSGWTHVEYCGMDFVDEGGSQILKDCKALKTITFGSEEVKNLFYSSEGNQSNINSIGGVETEFLPAAMIGTVEYATLKEAFEAAQDGDTIKLVTSIKLSEIITNNKKVTLDLNGKNITGTDTTTKNFSLIDNRSELTVTGNGRITLKATVNSGWGRYSAVLANNPGGKLVVENGTIEHLGGTDMAYGIDNLTNGKGTYAETVINGGTIKSTYRGIRQFLNGIEAQNILTVNAGTVEGDNKSIFFHDPSKNANTGTLTVNDGATLVGDVYLYVTEGSTEWPVEVSLAASAVTGQVLSANVPPVYAIVNSNGYYGIENISSSRYKVTAIADATEGRYNNGNPDSFTVKYVVTGGNVLGAMAQFEYDNELFVCAEDRDGDGVVRMNSNKLTTDQNGETLLKELTFTVKANPEDHKTYTFIGKYVQVVSDYDAAGSGAQDGFVENLVGTDVKVVSQRKVTLPADDSLSGEIIVDKNADYPVVINDFDENKIYTITYTMGTTETTVDITKDNVVNNGFVIANVTDDIEFTSVTSKLNFQLVLLPDIITGHTLVMVKDGVSAGYKYDGTPMYAIERYVGLTSVERTGFIGDITNATSVRAILIEGGITEDAARALIEVDTVASKTIEESFDVNGNGKFFFNDAMVAHGSYKVQYNLATEMAWYLRSDVNTDFIIDTDDYDDTVEAWWATIDG